jgi:penicillin-binding protein 1C
LAGSAVAAYGVLQTAIASIGPLPLGHASHLVAEAGATGAAPTALQPVALTSRPTVVDPEDVDPLYLKMLFTFEDRRFYWHFGVDPIALLRAAVQLGWEGKIVTGGSTLTMQVARILEDRYRRTPLVKMRQIVRALQLEQTFSKREILRLYLNMAPFGGHRKGVSAATLSYFGKLPAKLTVGEAALLVALPQAPEARRIDRDPEAARRARNFVLRVVASAGVITEAQARKAMQEPIVPVPAKDPRRVTSLGR